MDLQAASRLKGAPEWFAIYFDKVDYAFEKSEKPRVKKRSRNCNESIKHSIQ